MGTETGSTSARKTLARTAFVGLSPFGDLTGKPLIMPSRRRPVRMQFTDPSSRQVSTALEDHPSRSPSSRWCVRYQNAWWG